MGSVRKAPTMKDAAPPGAADVKPAWRSPRAIILFLVVAAFGLAADLLTKSWAFGSLLNDPQLPEMVRFKRELYPPTITNREMLMLVGKRGKLMPGVQLSLSTNKGVVFGLPMPTWAVACATIVTIGLVAFFFASADVRAWPMHLSMALILAGAMGNLYDRLFGAVALPTFPPIRHEVRDFIDCSQIPLPFGLSYIWVFNLADVWLVIGVGMLLVYWALAQRKPVSPAKPGKAGRDSRDSPRR